MDQWDLGAKCTSIRTDCRNHLSCRSRITRFRILPSYHTGQEVKLQICQAMDMRADPAATKPQRLGSRELELEREALSAKFITHQITGSSKQSKKKAQAS